MKAFYLLTVLLLSLNCQIIAQSTDVGGMNITWEHDKDTIHFTVNAPDDGWVGLGFNAENSITNSNLILVNVINGTVSSEEFYVVSPGNPKSINAVGSSIQHSRVRGFEKNGNTTISFSMPVRTIDTKHYNLEKGHKIWLICAFSMEDEFEHHSRMRKHIEVVL